MQTITPCLWLDTEAQEAAELYTSVFPDSTIGEITYYGSAGPRPAGTVLTVSFELRGRPFIAFNGGPRPPFTEAVSFEVRCADQDEVDRYWSALTADGGAESQCGWLRDRFGLSWQIVPERLYELLADPDAEKVQRVMAALLEMVKIDVGELERAAAAAPVA